MSQAIPGDIVADLLRDYKRTDGRLAPFRVRATVSFRRFMQQDDVRRRVVKEIVDHFQSVKDTFR